jgi:squalene cyclase
MAAGFMINYHMYRNYWPLMALGRYKRHREGAIRRSTDL